MLAAKQVSHSWNGSSRPARRCRLSACNAVPKLTYFPITGRAETARLLFTLGGIAFEDNRIDFAEWPSFKPSTPFGQIPVLEVDGKVIAQSGAIDHYAAKLAGLYPSDPLKAALADQAYFFCEDLLQTVVPTFKIKDPEEQAKARQELLEGALKDKLDLLSKLVEGRPGKYIVGDDLTIADVAIFHQLSFLQSGLLTGLPTDLLTRWPALKAFRNGIATLPEVTAYYFNATDEPRKIGYRPDA
eukprot:gene4727-4977_t